MIPSQERLTSTFADNSNEDIDHLVQWTNDLDEIELLSQ